MGARGPKSKAEKATPTFGNRALPSRQAVAVLKPPRELGKHGMALWDRIVTEFAVDSAAAVELLCEACQALDRAEDCAAQIARDGLMSESGREHALVRHELANRAFSAKIIQRLGLDSL